MKAGESSISGWGTCGAYGKTSRSIIQRFRDLARARKKTPRAFKNNSSSSSFSGERGYALSMGGGGGGRASSMDCKKGKGLRSRQKECPKSNLYCGEGQSST